MRNLGSLALLVALLVATTSCAQDKSGHEPAAGLSEQRLILSEGYSQLYTDAGHLDLARLVLYVKIESQEFNDVITEIGRFGGELEKDLKRIASEYPGVRIDLDPLPEMEKRKRLAVGWDRAFQFAPFSGRSRVEYERTMLISMFNALNHESHLCQVMAAEEPDPGLKKFLLASEKRFRELSELALNLLNREHFRNDTHPAAKP